MYLFLIMHYLILFCVLLFDVSLTGLAWQVVRCESTSHFHKPKTNLCFLGCLIFGITVLVCVADVIP